MSLNSNAIPSPLFAPVAMATIPSNFPRVFPEFVMNTLRTFNQVEINRISNLYGNIYDIQDASGIKYGDVINAFTQSERVPLPSQYNRFIPYGNFFGGILSYLPFMILKQSFADRIFQAIGSPPPIINQFLSAAYQLETDEKILQFYRITFYNPILTTGALENWLPAVINVLNNINNPPPALSPSPAENSNTRTLENVNRNLTYLTGIGFKQNSDNETMKKTLKRYKNLTGTNYVFPTNTPSREDLERDLRYLFGLGLTPESGNETLNNLLAKWKDLTGSDYVYNQSGGKNRRKIRKQKSLRKKVRKQKSLRKKN